MLRCKELGFTVMELEQISFGLVMDMMVEKSNDEFNYPYTYPTYFSVYGIGGYGRRLYGTSTTSSEEHNGHAGISGMVKIYKYS